MNNSITEFYNNQKVFITGATGFVGKPLLEKLLRTCSTHSIYLLMRPKRGLDTEQRLKQLFQNPLFDTIREKNPNAFEKVQVINGDISQLNFGINDQDRKFIKENINIVFHSAATIKFSEDLKTAITLNTVGTKTILEMCQEMKQLKSFVYVSTAYSNPHQKDVEEIVYKTFQSPHDVIRSVNVLSRNEVDRLEARVLKTYPNTYSFTKALAENLVLEFSEIIPAAIVRPSIVTSIWKDPLPGWLENISGVTALTLQTGCGAVNSILCEEKCILDLIPVDVVVNTLITAAWHTKSHKSNALRVYNCTSGASNGISYEKYSTLVHQWWKEYPSKYVLWYPWFTYRTNRLFHNLCCVWYHAIPSALLDLLLICRLQKPMMLKRNKLSQSTLEALSFFTTREWNFENSTMALLKEHVNMTADGDLFPVDVSETTGFEWYTYVKNYILGIRQYILKDDPSSLPMARAKLTRMYWLQKLPTVVGLCVAAKCITLAFKLMQ